MKTFYAILIVLATLVAGYAMGFLSNSWLHDQRMKSFLKYRTEAGFRHVALDVLSPDKEQLELVGPIIDEYARLNRDLNRSYRRDMEALQISYFNELEPYLTQKQIERFIGEAPVPRYQHRQIRHNPTHNPDRAVEPRPVSKPRPVNRTMSQDTLISDTAGYYPPARRPYAGEPGYGAPRPSPEDRAERFSLTMKRRLLLDEPQYQAVRKVNLSHASQMKEIHEKYKGVDHRSMMNEIATLETVRNTELKTILSPTQYEQYLVMMDQLKQTWIRKRQARQ